MSDLLLAVGRVVRPHGVRGELLLDILTDFPERLAEKEVVYLGEAAVPHPLRRARVHRGRLLIQLEDCLTLEAAEALRGQLVQIKEAEASPLPAGRYYQHQILGLDVLTETGEKLGQVTEILETGANDVYVVTGPGGEVLLPALNSVVIQIDLEAHRIIVRLMDGLRPET